MLEGYIYRLDEPPKWKDAIFDNYGICRWCLKRCMLNYYGRCEGCNRHYHSQQLKINR